MKVTVGYKTLIDEQPLLDNDVRNHLNDGWELYGQPVVKKDQWGHLIHIQTMIKTETR